ncbi:MAG: hypothetical protein VYA34_14820 [Myxococcota bacterium]|nr:hypothetical protein [Myxococcota bacterium]
MGAFWPVFDEYREALEQRKFRENIDAMLDASAILEQKGNILPYRAIVVDEAQDIPAAGFE